MENNQSPQKTPRRSDSPYLPIPRSRGQFMQQLGVAAKNPSPRPPKRPLRLDQLLAHDLRPGYTRRQLSQIVVQLKTAYKQLHEAKSKLS